MLPTTILGRTGLRVTKLGLGCGGPSRLGLKLGASRHEAVRVIRHAIERGINFLDTAEEYTTEPQVAQAIRESGRDGVIVSTKKVIERDGKIEDVAKFEREVDQTLQRLDTDRVDIFHLHSVKPEFYRVARERFVPLMDKLQRKGKIRFRGITEEFNSDFRHEMLAEALRDDCWDVMMTGYNIINQTAAAMVLPETMKRNIGTLGMFVVRRALSDPVRLREVVGRLIDEGRLDDDVDRADPLGFLVRDGVAGSVAEAGYRLGLHEPGLHVTLTGTGNVAHLDANIAAASRPPLPPEVVARLRHMFARVDNVAGN